jgi:hypothetical protein
MNKETGKPSFPIWLIGDSNPKNWQDILEYPLDSKHPARHNIWTSVLEVIQRNLFEQCGKIFNVESIYIRNAIESPSSKPKGDTLDWNQTVINKIEEFKDLIELYKPPIIITFGAFAFEFSRRTESNSKNKNFGYWGAEKLGNEFRTRTDNFDIKTSNIIPLLHTSISRGFFLESHEYFTKSKTENYFEYTGKIIAALLLKHKNELNIWYN